MKMNMRKTAILFLCVLSSASVLAGTDREHTDVESYSLQQPSATALTVKGSVKDNLGTPIVGATITVKATNKGVVSSIDGNYSIEIPYKEAVLMVSFIGYAPQEIQVAGRTAIDITLIEEAKALDEVVVVGYNVQRKETITGSVSTITTRELRQSPTANINNALAGRLPGLMVNQFDGGEPGNDMASLNVRGIPTYGNSSAIMIVDGIERDFGHLSPDEIETFTILKDASATAPYGVRGANGVIIVTTKRGRAGEKPTVEFKASVGVSEPIKYPSYLGSADYATLYNEAVKNDGLSSRTLFSDQAIANYRRAKGDNSDGLGYNYDYFDYAFKPSITQDYTLSVRGGTDVVRYFIMGGFYRQGGNYKYATKDNDNKFIKYNFRTNVDVNATKHLKVSVDLSARVTDYTYPGATANDIISLANTQPPYLPIILPNNRNGINDEDYTNNGGYLLFADDNTYRYNMLGQLTRTGESTRTRRYLNGSIKLAHDLNFLTEGLSVGAQFSYDAYNQHTVATTVPTHSIGNLVFPSYSTWKLQDGSTDLWMNDAGYWIKNGVYVNANDRPTHDPKGSGFSQDKPTGSTRFQARVDYTRKFGDHDVSAMLLGYLQSKKEANAIPYRYMGLSGRMTYGYKNRYLAEFNVGYNGSENFAPGKRFGFFPAVSLGWVLSEENFMRSADWISHLKLRGSFGLVGNDALDGYRFMYIQEYVPGTSYTNYFGFTHTGSGIKTSLDEDIFANTNLTWEKAQKLNVGIDAEFFQHRLTFSVDAFWEHRYDVITFMGDDSKYGIKRLGFPAMVGNSTPITNSGIINSYGVDFELSWAGRIGMDFRYWIKTNFTFARNKIIETNERNWIDKNGQDCTWRYATGRRIGQNFCYLVDHFVKDQEEADMLNASSYQNFGALGPGDVVYKDLNGDGVIDEYDRAAYGNPRVPEFQYGIPFGFSYKGFDMSFLVQGSALCSVQLGGPAVWDFPLYDHTRIGKVKNMHLDRWTPQTAETAKYPAVHWGLHPNNKNEHSSLFVYDASYVRLKNIEIGYSLPQKWLSKVNIQSVRLFIQAQNLLTIDNLNDVDMDPEVKNGDGAWFPIQRVYNFGATITF